MEATTDYISLLLYRRRELLTQETSAQMAIEHELGEIRCALLRLQVGTFGYCETCNRTIESQRLTKIPYARCCVECQAEFERSRH